MKNIAVDLFDGRVVDVTITHYSRAGRDYTAENREDYDGYIDRVYYVFEDGVPATVDQKETELIEQEIDDVYA